MNPKINDIQVIGNAYMLLFFFLIKCAQVRNANTKLQNLHVWKKVKLDWM